MIIKAVDLGSAYEVTGEVNPFQKRIKLISKNYLEDIYSLIQENKWEEVERKVIEKKVSKVIFGFPVTKTLFRKYVFPFKNKEKIEKAVKGQLSVDLPLSLEDVEYAYVVKEIIGENKVEVFCVIVPKEDISHFKHSVDSEIFALMRLCKNQDIHNGTVVHFAKNYIYKVRFRDNFPESVRVIREDEIKNKELHYREDTVFSGFIPDYIPRDRILNNPVGDPKYNVAYGLLLKSIDDFGVDFTHKYDSQNINKLLKGALYLSLAIFFINVGLFTYGSVKERILRKIKSQEKEIYIKYFSASGEVYDPLLQAKGLVSSVKKYGYSPEDAADVLNEIGKAKEISGVKEIYKINISGKLFVIQGRASTIKDVEKFKNALSIKYKAKIEETINTPQGDIRFTIKGEVG